MRIVDAEQHGEQGHNRQALWQHDDQRRLLESLSSKFVLESHKKGAEWLPFSLRQALTLSALIHGFFLYAHQELIHAPNKKSPVRIAVTFTPKAQEKTGSLIRETEIISRRLERRTRLRETVENSNPPSAPPILPETPKKETFLDFELDTQPAPVGELTLDPQELIPKEIVGRMVLELLISKEGVVLWSNITASDFDDRTNQQLSSEFQATRFIPGVIAGTPVDALIRVEIERTN